ncbi:hypothetical protein KHP62_10910 [Rhodobacteraceae bacterium NNCM2]|nr:hypothetical protein [Coraliihabitans acroporae]
MSTTMTVDMNLAVDAKVMRTDCDEGDCVENQPLPAAMAARPIEEKSPAEWAYERMALYIQKFEEMLDSDQEVAMGFAGSDAGTLHIQGMGYFAPDIITFYGVGPNGAKTQLVQHVSQLSVMLRAAPKIDQDREANRIGFRMREKMEAENAGDA